MTSSTWVGQATARDGYFLTWLFQGSILGWFPLHWRMGVSSHCPKPVIISTRPVIWDLFLSQIAIFCFPLQGSGDTHSFSSVHSFSVYSWNIVWQAMHFCGVTMVKREKYGKTEEPLEFLILKMALLLFWVIMKGWASPWLSMQMQEM